MTTEIDSYWNKYLLTLPEDQRHQTYYEAESWGNSAELADIIAPLVRDGEKTTTSRLKWDFDQSGDTLEKIGDKSIVLNALQEPVCIIEVTDIFIRPFDQVDADFVYNYGEGSRDMDFWNKNMWDYYVEECAEIGRSATPDMPMICQVFKVIFK